QVLIDSPLSGVSRDEMRLDELHLTKFRLRFLFSNSKDFDCFKLHKARQIRNKLRTDAFYRLKKKN
ncbi:hypothetical protein ALC56_02529, partial [Trachymyrmex septentrionalis]